LAGKSIRPKVSDVLRSQDGGIMADHTGKALGLLALVLAALLALVVFMVI
jgi:hypothetical protein